MSQRKKWITDITRQKIEDRIEGHWSTAFKNSYHSRIGGRSVGVHQRRRNGHCIERATNDYIPYEDLVYVEQILGLRVTQIKETITLIPEKFSEQLLEQGN